MSVEQASSQVGCTVSLQISCTGEFAEGTGVFLPKTTTFTPDTHNKHVFHFCDIGFSHVLSHVMTKE